MNNISELFTIDKILGIIAAVNGLVAVISLWRSNKAKAQFDVSQANAVDIKAFQDLIDKVSKQGDEISVLRDVLDKMKRDYQALWRYMVKLLEQMRRKNIKPVEPDEDFPTDPELLSLIHFDIPKQKRPKKKAGK
jgi:flagellar motor component MotA